MTHDASDNPERRDPDYAKGKDEPEVYPEDERLGRFSEGEEELPPDTRP